MKNGNQYRTDIDGLRAIAVLSVIIFHINHSLLPGGFIGVDIFFVISGYLISLHIFNEMDTGTFSLKEFYRRRIKRIMPAMFLVVGTTLIFSQIIMLPKDSINVANSSIFSLLSIANVYFWKFNDSSYFASSSDEIPLLHLWSLGVEEQFYIFWPIVILIMYKRLNRQLFISVLVCTIIVSTLIGELLYSRSHSFIYYMLPSRAGELLIGAVVAYLHKDSTTNLLISITSNFNKFICTLGLFLIMLSFFIIDKSSVFPGVITLIPTIGTGLVLFGGKSSLGVVYKLLSIKSLSWVGKISYSAYLWHWPLLAFYRYSYGAPNLMSGSIIFILTLTLAWLTYTFIEQAFRYSKSNFYQICTKQFVVPVSILLVLSTTFIVNKGYLLKSQKYEILLSNMDQNIISPNRYEYVCQKWELDTKEVQKDSCIIGNDVDKEPPQILLWGDSNAAHYIGILGVFAKQTNTPFRNFSHAACPPINKDPKGIVIDKILEQCRKSLEVAFKEIPKYKYLIVGASHTSYIKKSDTYFEDFKSMILNFASKGKEIVLLGKAPVFENFDRKCMQKSLSIPFTSCKAIKKPISKEIFQVNIELKNLANQNQNIHYYDVNKFLCNQEDCSPYKADNSVLYFDSSHIEIQASWKIGEEIISIQGVPAELKFLFKEREVDTVMINTVLTSN